MLSFGLYPRMSTAGPIAQGAAGTAPGVAGCSAGDDESLRSLVVHGQAEELDAVVRRKQVGTRAQTVRFGLPGIGADADGDKAHVASIDHRATADNRHPLHGAAPAAGIELIGCVIRRAAADRPGSARIGPLPPTHATGSCRHCRRHRS